MSTLVTAPRGRMGAYALWQMRDYAPQAMWTVLISGALGVFPMLMSLQSATRNNIDAESLDKLTARAFDTPAGLLAFLGPVLAVATLVSADRSPGLARFLFSKPISVVRYYLQAWLVRGLSFLAVATLLLLAFNQFVAHVPWAGALGAAAVSFVLIGGVGFLLSVLVAQDAGALVIVYLLPDMFDSIGTAYPKWTPVCHAMLDILPPMHRLDEIRRAFLMHTPMPMDDLWHALAYGTGCVILGAFLVRRLPLVR